MKKIFMLLMLVVSLGLFAGDFSILNLDLDNGNYEDILAGKNNDITISIETELLKEEGIPEIVCIYGVVDKGSFTDKKVYNVDINGKKVNFIYMEVFSDVLITTKTEPIQIMKKESSVKFTITDDKNKKFTTILNTNGFTKEYNKFMGVK